MLIRCDANELAEWEAYDRIDPIGHIREEFFHGQLCSLLVRLHVPKSKAKPADFMPFAEMSKPKRPEMSIDEMKRNAIKWVIATGGIYRKAGAD